MFKDMHALWKNIEPYKSLLEICCIAGSGGFLGWSIPLVGTLGKPLSVIIAITIMMVLYLVIKKIILLNQPKNELGCLAPDKVYFKLEFKQNKELVVLDSTGIRNYKILVYGDRAMLIVFEFFYNLNNPNITYRFYINGYKNNDKNPVGSISYKDLFETKNISIMKLYFKDHTFSDIDYLEIKWEKHQD